MAQLAQGAKFERATGHLRDTPMTPIRKLVSLPRLREERPLALEPFCLRVVPLRRRLSSSSAPKSKWSATALARAPTWAERGRERAARTLAFDRAEVDPPLR